jgi:hypothetical protein
MCIYVLNVFGLVLLQAIAAVVPLASFSRVAVDPNLTPRNVLR